MWSHRYVEVSEDAEVMEDCTSIRHHIFALNISCNVGVMHISRKVDAWRELVGKTQRSLLISIQIIQIHLRSIFLVLENLLPHLQALRVTDPQHFHLDPGRLHATFAGESSLALLC